MPTSNGIVYAERGDGPPLICIHGAGGQHGHWGKLLAPLAPHARLIALDLPGHGRSAGPGETTIQGYAAAVAALIEGLRLERPLLAGHSMGGAVALELATTRPELVGGLALIGSGARLRVAPALLDGLTTDPEPAIDQLVAWMLPHTPELRAAAAAEYRNDPATLRADLAACDGWDVRPRLSGLTLPAVVVCGEDDVMTPPKLARELAELLNAELTLLPQVGHVPMLEAPEATAEALIGWLRVGG